MDTRLVAKEKQLQTWAAIIQDCKLSGMKTKDWLAENNISKDQYYYWFRLLREQAALEQQSTNEIVPSNQVVKIECDDAEQVLPAADVIDISMGRLNIKIPVSVDTKTIQAIMEVAVRAK